MVLQVTMYSLCVDHKVTIVLVVTSSWTHKGHCGVQTILGTSKPDGFLIEGLFECDV